MPPSWRRRPVANAIDLDTDLRTHELGRLDEVWNALTHGFGFLASLLASAVLITLVAIRRRRLAAGRRAGVLHRAGAGLHLVDPLPLDPAPGDQAAHEGVRPLRDFCPDRRHLHALHADRVARSRRLVAVRGGLDPGRDRASCSSCSSPAASRASRRSCTSPWAGWRCSAIKPLLATVPMPTLLWLLAGGLAYTLRHAVLHEQARARARDLAWLRAGRQRLPLRGGGDAGPALARSPRRRCRRSAGDVLLQVARFPASGPRSASLTRSPIETTPITRLVLDHRQVTDVLLGHDRHAFGDRFLRTDADHRRAHITATGVSARSGPAG